MNIDFDRARHTMIEQQIRPWDVLDQRVLDVLGKVHREDFVPPRYRRMAFTDVALPLDHNEFMMKPIVEGRTLQSLAIQPEDSVLEIGTGSGFLTACLAELSREVLSIEVHESMADRARAKLQSAGFGNTRVETANAITNFEATHQFDVICVTGAVHHIPQKFKDWLRVGGRLFVVHGEAPAMEAALITRISETDFSEESLFETELPYLQNAAPTQAFAL